MPDQRLIVLKFGGSVLTDADSLNDAAHEIDRWRRDAYRVVAVVSAFAGATDRLLAGVRRLCPDAQPHTVAAALAQGESESACALGAVLDRAGIPAVLLTPGAIGLVARGSGDDADPVSLDTGVIERALDDTGVVIVPGFVARDELGRPVLLGRGGSDLTAIFLAARLNARCRLIKDVDALYEHDPKAPGPAPRRFNNANYDDELTLDPGIIQPKAVRAARSLGLAFELTSINSVRPSRISADPTELGEEAQPPPPLRVALLGFGTVGAGVYHHLARLAPAVRVVAVAVRDPSRARDTELPSRLVTTDAVGAAGSGVDVVIEAIGGLTVASEAVEGALRSGAHVVTANKALLARRWDHLHALGDRHGASVRCSASVGAGVPVLGALFSRPGHAVRSVRAVLNGTTNFVLDRIARGDSVEEAIGHAQRLGYAESDPSADLDAHDAADKLCVIARTLGVPLAPETVARDAWTAPDLDAARAGAAQGSVVRQVATLDLSGPAPRASVRIALVGPGDPLFDLPGVSNAAVIAWDDGVGTIVRGRGAGRWPTSQGVIADVLRLLREHAHAHTRHQTLPATQPSTHARPLHAV